MRVLKLQYEGCGIDPSPEVARNEALSKGGGADSPSGGMQEVDRREVRGAAGADQLSPMTGNLHHGRALSL